MVSGKHSPLPWPVENDEVFFEYDSELGEEQIQSRIDGSSILQSIANAGEPGLSIQERIELLQNDITEIKHRLEARTVPDKTEDEKSDGEEEIEPRRVDRIKS